MKRIILWVFTVICAGTTIQVNAQNDAIFHSVKYTILADYFQSKSVEGKYNGSVNESGIPANGLLTGNMILTLVYDFRYNLRELNDDFAISAMVSPSIGVGAAQAEYAHIASSGSLFGEVGFGYLNLSIMPGIEFGAGSTYNSSKNVGSFLRVGFDYMMSPIGGLQETNDYEFDKQPKGWAGLALQTGIRYYSKKNRMREVNIKYWHGGKQALGADEKNAYHARLSWGFILDY